MTKIAEKYPSEKHLGISQECLICNEGFCFCKWKELVVNFTQPFESSKGAHLQRKSTMVIKLFISLGRSDTGRS